MAEADSGPATACWRENEGISSNHPEELQCILGLRTYLCEGFVCLICVYFSFHHVSFLLGL